MEELDLESLLETLKDFDRGEQVILGHFGTVQTLLSMVFGQPVMVKLIDQHEEEGDIIRRVYLMAGDKLLCYAVSHIPKSRNRDDVIYDIASAQLGLGQIIACHQLPTRRSLTGVGRDREAFWRSYIIEGPEVYIQISETFPKKPFEDIGWIRPVKHTEDGIGFEKKLPQDSSSDSDLSPDSRANKLEKIQGRPESSSLISPSQKNVHARHLFDGIAHNYDGPAQIFSIFQYSHWRRFLVSRLKLSPQALVLDVGTGPGGVAANIAKNASCNVVAVDLSDHMLAQAQSNLRTLNLTSLISLVKARAENLPFPNHSFDVVVFTFLFRYVDDPQAMLHELARVLKPGGQMASLEFYVPKGPFWHPLWLLHTRLVLPLGTRLLTPGWREVGSFLGPSISNFFNKQTLEDLEKMWTQAGLGNVQTKLLSRGGAFVMWGQKGARSEG